MHPTALHWTSTFGESICRIRGGRPPSCTMRTLFSAAGSVSERNRTTKFPRAQLTVYGKVAQSRTRGALYLDVGALEQKQYGLEGIAIDFPDVCRISCQQISPTASRCPLAVQNIHTSLGDLSERQTRASLEVDVVGENKGAQGSEGLAGEEVGLASLRGISLCSVVTRLVGILRTFSRYCRRSATASRSLSARTGSYRPSRDLAVVFLESRATRGDRGPESYLHSMTSCKCPSRQVGVEGDRRQRCRSGRLVAVVARGSWLVALG